MRRETTTDGVQRHLDKYPYKPRDNEFNAPLVDHMRDEHVDAWARWMVGDTLGDIEDQHYIEHGMLTGEAEMRREIALDASVARHPAGKRIGR